MNGCIRILLVINFLYLHEKVGAQEKNYTVTNAHAHNDYLNEPPFYLAYKSGFGSIEADVFPVKGVLHVAHSKKEIKADATLKDLYLTPLKEVLSSGDRRNLILLIDIKEDYKTSLTLLLKELQPLKPFLNSSGEHQPVTIIISGERPSPADYRNYPGYIFFDARPGQQHTPQQWERVALVSLAFNQLSAWKGAGDPGEKDVKAIKSIIDSVHQAGKPIRFWGAPDTKLSWQWQIRWGADLVGTDRIKELCNFLKE